MVQIDQFFIEHPELKAYVYEEKEWPNDPKLQNQIMSSCEMVADLFQQLIELAKETQISRYNLQGWQIYMKQLYDNSNSFRHFFSIHGKWYTTELLSTLSSCNKKELECSMKIDYPDIKQLKNDDTLWNIYQDSFPYDEKESVDIIIKTILQKKGIIIRACCIENYCVDEDTIGFAFIHFLKKTNVKFLVYLAVSKIMQNHGIGSQLLSEIKKLKNTDMIIAEVDDPDTSKDQIEFENRKSRLKFFERNGFIKLKQAYWQPPVSNEKQPVKMILMSYGNKLYSAEEIVRMIYVQKYGDMNSISADQLNELVMRS